VGLACLVAAALAPNLARPQGDVVIGAKTFAEQYVLSALIADRVRGAGFAPAQRDGLGSAVVFQALAAGDIDVYVDYSGTIWANQMGRSDARGRDEVLREVGTWLRMQHGVAMLGSLGFENAYGIAVTREKAEQLGLTSIADLARHAPTLSIAGDYEFFGRPEWAALRDAYGLAFREQRQMQAEFMYSAASAGEVDVITAFTSDGRIAQHDLVVLDDPRQAIPPYDAILLVSARKSGDRAFTDALRPLIGAIDVELMREANLRIAVGGADASPAEVARWLEGEIAQRRAEPAKRPPGPPR
jgi:osmoprotectant transport system permease protein